MWADSDKIVDKVQAFADGLRGLANIRGIIHLKGIWMDIQYRMATLEDLQEICNLFDDAVETMIQNKIFQWDELYPTKKDFRKDIERDRKSVV